MSSTVRIALIQQSASGTKSENVARGVENARVAAKRGAQILCFAELAFEPFYPQRPAEGNEFRSFAEPVPGPITEEFRRVAKETGTVIVLNLFEREGEATYDCSPVIGPDGELLGKTRMIHITDYDLFHERGYYAPGDRGAPVYETPFGRIGVAICYDRHYPEYMRALALGGADIVFIPQAGAVDEWPEGVYEAEVQVAAFQNGYFAALCNRVGKEERLEFAGESFVYSPMGQRLARAGRGTEEILFADLDPELLDACPARRLFLRDRRPELYREWFA